MSNISTEQQVGVSPKVAIPTALLTLAGIVLMILDVLGVIDVEDEIWITLLGSGGLTFGAGYASRPGLVLPPDTPRRGDRSSWGKRNRKENP